MNMLEDLIDDVLAVIFDDRGADMPASIVAAELAARIMNGGTRRADLVQSVARLIVAINADLREREALKREPLARAQLADAPRPKRTPVRVGRQWRVSPIAGDLVPERSPDPTASLMGDPAPGRSALDQSQGGRQ
jgi:hypothetical protein